MNKIIWIASYPKSGNTWFRLFLTNLLRDAEEPADINDTESTPIASARGIADEEIGVETSDLTPAEIARLRPKVYEQVASEAEEPLFMKVHDAWTLLDDGTPLLSARATRGAIYIIRNPMDVAISAADFNGSEIYAFIARLADNKATLASQPKRLADQLGQILLSWSEHVLSWVDRSGVPIHVMRYEDMGAEPLAAFTAAVRFAGLEHDEEQIARAIRFSAFDELKRQEQEKGFREKSVKQKQFFRSGTAGGWADVLTGQQVEQVIADHGPVMKRFGYL